MSSWKRRSRLLVSLLAVLPVIVSGASGGVPGALTQSSENKAVVGTDDEEFARLVKEWTTRPEFNSPLVDHLPKVQGIPTPKDVLGHHVGAPKILTYYADI